MTRQYLYWAILSAAPLLGDGFGPGFPVYSMTPIFRNDVNSQGLPLIPVSYGGLTLNPANWNQLLIGGTAEGSGAALYSIGVVRDAAGHIQGLSGRAALFAVAPKLAAGVVFGPSFSPGEVLFYTIASGSSGVDVGMIRWGGFGPGRVVDLVPDTPGGLGFAPPGVKGFGIDGGLKILTTTGRFFSARAVSEPTGTYDFGEVRLMATLPVSDTQGFAYVPGGSPGFVVDSLLVAEHRAGSIAAYEVDSRGDPIASTRRVFFSGPPFARPEGLFVDPLTGDLLVTTHSSSTSGIYVIRGFTLPSSTPISSCQTITAPGFYHLSADLKSPPYADCLKIENVSSVHLDCRGHTLEGWGEPPVLLVNVNGFSIRNCRVALEAPPGDYIGVDTSRNGVISGNRIAARAAPMGTGQPYGRIRLSGSQSLNVVNNWSQEVVLWLPENSGSTVRYNQCTAPKEYACIIVSDGTGNTIDSNQVQTTSAALPFDPGVWAAGGRNLIVSNNLVSTVGRGIELGGLTDSTVSGNFVRAPYIGYSAVWDMKNVTWMSNRFVSTRTGMGPDAGVAFAGTGLQGNTFVRNLFADAEARSRFSFAPPGSNAFTQNDFGHAVPGPDFGTPGPGAVIDGGGNICLPPPGAYPLACRLE